MVIVANRISEILGTQGKTPYWLAKTTHISTQSIYHIIQNSTDIDEMKYKTLRLIAQALGVEIEDLRARDEKN